ncbi:MAG: class F sortase [Anaerolineales bacterium]|nr:class F sortase [Anaerolineales bacterium]
MRRSTLSLLVVVLIVSILAVPVQTVYAQISLPAEMNKSFSPISIPSGGTSRLSVTIFNPNPFVLTDASWSDNLIGVQPGLTIASPAGLTNTCGGSVGAPAGGTTLSLSGGTVPAQSGNTPGSCTVSINVTSVTPGNLINTIPAGALSSTGGGVSISNTTPASATLNVTGNPAPTVSKSFSPGTIWAGATSQLSIVIRNNDPGRSLTQASITDNLPANVFLADPVSASLTGCGASASLTAVSGGASVTLNNGTIAPNSSCMIMVDVISDTQGSYTNRIPANALQTQQGVTNRTAATARLHVQEIDVTKRFSPATFPAGGTTTLIITLQNPMDFPYTGVNFTDNLPAPLTVLGVTGNTCGGTTSTTANSVSLSGGTIPAGSPTSLGTCRISVQVTAPAGTSSGTFTNTIPEGAVTTDQGVGNLRPANANVTVSGTSAAGTKSFSPSAISAGNNSRLRIDFFAPGDTNLTNFSITDNLPSGVTVSNSSPAAVSGCGGAAVLNAPTGATSISLTNGLILSGQRCRIEVYVTSSTIGTHTNSIPPTNITNNENRIPTGSLTSTLRVTGGGTLAIELVKGFDPLTVFGGSASTMSIELINPGTVPLTGIAFTDNMPNRMILATPVNFNVGTCGGTLNGIPGANSFSFSGGSLPPLGRCTLTLSATMTVNGNLTNRIPAGAVTTANGVSNADPVEATLTNLPGASVSKFFSPNPISAGSQSLLTITIQNTGNIELIGMGLNDSLPAGLVIAGGSVPVNNCGGTFTAIAGTRLIQLTNGTLAGNSSCTIVVAVTGSNLGDYINTIPAGALITDPSVGATNSQPATDTLTITGSSTGGGGGGGRGRANDDPPDVSAPTGAFLIPVTGFAPGRATQRDNPSRPVYEVTSLAIEIPVLRVNASIVGVESKNGSWDVAWLQDQIGWLNGTAYPTWQGNSVLTAHVVNADGKPGVFYRLKSLGVGEYIFVYNSGYRYTYRVVSNAYVQPDDITVMRHEEKSYLTLITCDSYDEKTGTYLRRVAVRAVLVDVRTTR